MSAVTIGVAMPSLRPLSTLSERRMLSGSDSSETTAALSAASVGASTAPSSAASSHGRSAKSAAASPKPDGDREGESDGEQPDRETGVAAKVPGVHPGGVGEQDEDQGDLGELVNHLGLDRDVHDGTGPLHRTSPATTNTMGPVISSRSIRPDTTDQTKTNPATAPTNPRPTWLPSDPGQGDRQKVPGSARRDQ